MAATRDYIEPLKDFLPEDGRVISHTIRHDALSYQGATAKEVRVSYSRKPKDIAGSQSFGQRGAMTFKRMSNDDKQFNVTVRDKLLAIIGQPRAVLTKSVADMLSSSDILDLRDEDIEGCTVLATVNGKSRTINIIEAGNFATRFPLGIQEYIKGHPDAAKTKAAMIRLLKHEIIARNESV